MLLGCCHCGEEPSSESVSSSDSGQSESLQSDSDGPLSTDPLTCGPCVVVPAKWIVTLSGWNGVNASHNACCSGMNGEYLLSISSRTSTPCTVSITEHCRIWESAEKASNVSTLPGTPPSCIDSTNPRIQLGMYTFGGNTSLVCSVLYGGVGPFSSDQADCFQYTFTTRAGCFYSGPLTWYTRGFSTPRCNIGTLTVRPA
jgi:hypothetical protein